MFPKSRSRRLRKTNTLRGMLRETRLHPAQLILPLFIKHGQKVRIPISSMPGQFQLSIDESLKVVEEALRAGIRAFLLFGIPAKKDAAGSEAYARRGIIQEAVRTLKREFPEAVLMTDLCFCEYTSHGHCGVIKKSGRGSWDVYNDSTLRLIRKTALEQARAGADFVAPSGMMDGAVKFIRETLDKEGFSSTGILAYAAKYASAFYGPFREAAESAPKFGDRAGYQMDAANSREALKEIEADIKEGADMVMVKPALSFLDVIRAAKDRFHVPVVAYNVSGEYSMVKAAGKLGWLDEKKAMLEILLSIKRAGADLIISYHALDAAKILASRHD